jgi:protease-4
MGSVAASGGYYISTSADKIVAEPGTITGSIGVFTGKVSIGKSLGMIGVTADQVSVGTNTLMNSDITPYSPEQWAALNAQADGIYADFKQKVATGRKLPLDKVEEIARGRVWTGADANARGLVDQLGGFWTAADTAKKLAHIAPSERVVFEIYPRQKNFFQALGEAFTGSSDEMHAVENFTTLMNAPVMHEAVTAVKSAPRSAIELRATNLPN